MGVESNGFEDMIARLDAAGPKATPALVKAVRDVAYDVLSDARTIAPKETGFMASPAASGVQGPFAGEGVVSAEIYFNASYALFVHENLTAKHAPGTGAKFLETPLEQSGPLLTRAIAFRLQEAGL